MYDASSKFQSGILSYNLDTFGNFDQCLNVENISTKYCQFEIHLSHQIIFESTNNLNRTEFDFEDEILLSYAICIFESCEVEDILQSTEDQLLKIGLSIYANKDACLGKVHTIEWNFYRLVMA